MQAFHGDKAIKAKYVARVRTHKKLDNIIQGRGWDNGKGCAVGCTLENYNHKQYPMELGIPVQIAYLEDRLFELSMPEDAKKWPLQFLRAIPVGADLSKVWGEWAQWMLISVDFGVVRYCDKYPACKAAVERVAELYRVGGTPEDFAVARRDAAAAAADAAAAYAAAADAAADAADAAAAYAAAAAAADAAAADAAAADAAAAYAAAAAAADAAAAYAAAAAAAAADAARRQTKNDWVIAARRKLLELLRETK